MSRSTYKLKCPHCHQGLRVRNSIGHHPLLRVAYLQCTNVVCGATFRSQMEITHVISESACPNPAVDLPLADSAIRNQAMLKEQEKQIDFVDAINLEDAQQEAS